MHGLTDQEFQKTMNTGPIEAAKLTDGFYGEVRANLQNEYQGLLNNLEKMQTTINRIPSSRRTSILQTKIDEMRLWIEDGMRKGQF